MCRKLLKNYKKKRVRDTYFSATHHSHHIEEVRYNWYDDQLTAPQASTEEHNNEQVKTISKALYNIKKQCIHILIHSYITIENGVHTKEDILFATGRFIILSYISIKNSSQIHCIVTWNIISKFFFRVIRYRSQELLHPFVHGTRHEREVQGLALLGPLLRLDR